MSIFALKYNFQSRAFKCIIVSSAIQDLFLQEDVLSPINISLSDE